MTKNTKHVLLSSSPTTLFGESSPPSALLKSHKKHHLFIQRPAATLEHSCAFRCAFGGTMVISWQWRNIHAA